MELRFMGLEAQYREAVEAEAREEAEMMHGALVKVDWNKLTERDRGVREALSWILGYQESRPRLSGAVTMPDEDDD